MQDINSIGKFSDVQDSPFSQDMNSNLSCARADNTHRLPVGWFQSALDGIEFKSSLPSGFGWKVAKIIKTRTNKP
jgi:hypothetical protein